MSHRCQLLLSLENWIFCNKGSVRWGIFSFDDFFSFLPLLEPWFEEITPSSLSWRKRVSQLTGTSGGDNKLIKLNRRLGSCSVPVPFSRPSGRPVDELHLLRRPADSRRAGGTPGDGAHLRAQQDAHRWRQHSHHRSVCCRRRAFCRPFLFSRSLSPAAIKSRVPLSASAPSQKWWVPKNKSHFLSPCVQRKLCTSKCGFSFAAALRLRFHDALWWQNVNLHQQTWILYSVRFFSVWMAVIVAVGNHNFNRETKIEWLSCFPLARFKAPLTSTTEACWVSATARWPSSSRTRKKFPRWWTDRSTKPEPTHCSFASSVSGKCVCVCVLIS